MRIYFLTLSHVESTLKYAKNTELKMGVIM